MTSLPAGALSRDVKPGWSLEAGLQIGLAIVKRHVGESAKVVTDRSGRAQPPRPRLTQPGASSELTSAIGATPTTGLLRAAGCSAVALDST
jgi:hypothetical protein